MTLDEFRLTNNKAITISVDNQKAKSHNINIDLPSFFAFALNKEEAIGKMMLSNFEYKHLPIYNIHIHEEY